MLWLSKRMNVHYKYTGRLYQTSDTLLLGVEVQSPQAWRAAVEMNCGKAPVRSLVATLKA